MTHFLALAVAIQDAAADFDRQRALIDALPGPAICPVLAWLYTDAHATLRQRQRPACARERVRLTRLLAYLDTITGTA